MVLGSKDVFVADSEEVHFVYVCSLDHNHCVKEVREPGGECSVLSVRSWTEMREARWAVNSFLLFL